MTHRLFPTSILVATLFAVTACADDDADTAATTTPPAAETTAPPAPTAAATGTIVDVAQAAGTFTTLVAAVQAAGLVDTLKGAGPFTVFAPSDEAFTKALASLGITAEQLLADKDKLTSILTYHVVPGKVLAADVVTLNGKDVATVNGATVKVTVNGSAVKVNDANVVSTDVMASNGVIHVIDSVLLPG